MYRMLISMYRNLQNAYVMQENMKYSKQHYVIVFEE